MNEIIKAMEERRSIRNFKPDMPAKEDLEQIICCKWHGKTGNYHNCGNK